jgi:hypothetical protein
LHKIFYILGNVSEFLKTSYERNVIKGGFKMHPQAKMPTTLILLYSAWLISIAGIVAGAYIIFTGGVGNPQAVVTGLAILLGSLFLSALVRMIGNIGQMLFDIKSFLYNNQRVPGRKTSVR